MHYWRTLTHGYCILQWWHFGIHGAISLNPPAFWVLPSKQSFGLLMTITYRQQWSPIQQYNGCFDFELLTALSYRCSGWYYRLYLFLNFIVVIVIVADHELRGIAIVSSYWKRLSISKYSCYIIGLSLYVYAGGSCSYNQQSSSLNWLTWLIVINMKTWLIMAVRKSLNSHYQQYCNLQSRI